MEDSDLRKVFFLHYQVVQEAQAALFQRAFADACSIAPTVEAAAIQAEQYLLQVGYTAVDLKSWRPAVHADLPEMDTIELALLEQARRRTPPVSARIVVGVELQPERASGHLH